MARGHYELKRRLHFLMFNAFGSTAEAYHWLSKNFGKNHVSELNFQELNRAIAKLPKQAPVRKKVWDYLKQQHDNRHNPNQRPADLQEISYTPDKPPRTGRKEGLSDRYRPRNPARARRRSYKARDYDARDY